MTIPQPILLSDGTALGLKSEASTSQESEMISADAADAVVQRNTTATLSDDDVEAVRYLLKTDKVAFVSALLWLYKKQTEDEQRAGHTMHQNNVGFRGGYEGQFMTSIARYYIKNQKLSESQINAGRKTILKYAGQLIRTGFIDDYLKQE